MFCCLDLPIIYNLIKINNLMEGYVINNRNNEMLTIDRKVIKPNIRLIFSI